MATLGDYTTFYNYLNSYADDMVGLNVTDFLSFPSPTEYILTHTTPTSRFQ